MPKYDLEKLTKGLSVSAGIAYNNYMADSSIKDQNYARYSLSKGAGERCYIHLTVLILLWNPMKDSVQTGVV